MMTRANLHPPSSRHDAVPRWVRALLCAFPSSFRRRHGAPLLDTLADAFASRAAGESTARRALFWLVAAADLLASGVMLRVRARRRGTYGAVVPAPPRLHRGGRTMSMLQDLRFALRALRRRPGFALLVVLTLALGLGANAAVYGLVDALLLDPVPVHRPQEVVSVFEALARGARYEGTSFPNYVDYRARTRSLTGLAGFGALDAGLVTGRHTERISLGVVSGNYFTLLGLRPATGRLLAPADEATPGTTPHVVLGHGLWRRLFGADTAAIGRAVRLNGATFTIVGVAPSGFRGTSLSSAPDAWIPITMVRTVGAGGLYSADVLGTRFFQWVTMVGRLRPGVTPESAERELNEIARRRRAELAEAVPADTISTPVRVAPITEGATIASREELLRFISLLGGVALLTLIIACLNVAGLMLSRGVERSRELGVRAALGAGRGRLVRQLLIESLLLAMAGGVAGLGVALGTFSLVRSFTLPGGIELASLALRLDPAVLSFAAAASVATVLAFGLLPAIRTTRGNVAQRVVAIGGRATAATGRTRTWLVAAQVALSLVLLSGAALLLRSLSVALRTDLGFDSRNVAALSIGLQEHLYDDARALVFARGVLDEIDRRPGVEHAAIARHVPIGGHSLRLPITLEGVGPDRARARAAVNAIMGDYFEALRIPLMAGRTLSNEDHDAGSPRVAVVNEAAARRLWPGESAIGKQFRLFGSAPIRVVGVVRDSRYHRLDEEPVPYLFVSASQFSGMGLLNDISIVARGRDASAAPLGALRSAVSTLDPTLPIFDARIVADQIDRVLMPQRFGLRLLGAFGALALLVSAVGIYGLVSYTVVQRTQEIGIRMALGAPRSNVLAVVTRQTLAAAAMGLVVGLGGALVAARLLAAFLHGITPRDPSSFALATAVLLAVAAVASAIPARRATRIDPVAAIRE